MSIICMDFYGYINTTRWQNLFQISESLHSAVRMLLRILLYVVWVCCGISLAQTVERQRYPNDCHRYYEKSLWSCPENFYWNDQLKQCQVQPVGGCSFMDSSPDSKSPSPVTEALNLPAICDNKLGQLIAYPGDCTRFIQCDYLPFVKTCPQYLFWNSRLSTCDKICV